MRGTYTHVRLTIQPRFSLVVRVTAAAAASALPGVYLIPTYFQYTDSDVLLLCMLLMYCRTCFWCSFVCVYRTGTTKREDTQK